MGILEPLNAALVPVPAVQINFICEKTLTAAVLSETNSHLHSQLHRLEQPVGSGQYVSNCELGVCSRFLFCKFNPS